MAGVVALVDSETALGFRLAGIETLVARQEDEALHHLKGLLERREPGVVIYSEAFIPVMPERLQKLVEESLQPVFVPVPRIRSWQEGERKEEYLARLLRRVIGYQIKIRR